MKVLIIAASKSDVPVMGKAAEVLAAKGIKAEMRVCSAHRTPEMLDRIMEKEDYDVVIAGAGLAAALPGVVAAKTLRPVIGMPLAGAFEGLDALLSIIQMPPGIPVITTGVNEVEEAALSAAKIVTNKARRVNIVAASAAKTSAKARQKAEETLQQLGVDYGSSDKIVLDSINICLVDINEKEVSVNDALTIFVPTADKETAADSLKLLQLTRKGVWVGLNRGENAAVAAAEILGMNDRLKEYRQDMRMNVEEADKEVRGSS